MSDNKEVRRKSEMSDANKILYFFSKIVLVFAAIGLVSVGVGLISGSVFISYKICRLLGHVFSFFWN